MDCPFVRRPLRGPGGLALPIVGDYSRRGSDLLHARQAFQQEMFQTIDPLTCVFQSSQPIVHFLLHVRYCPAQRKIKEPLGARERDRVEEQYGFMLKIFLLRSIPCWGRAMARCLEDGPACSGACIRSIAVIAKQKVWALEREIQRSHGSRRRLLLNLIPCMREPK